MINIIEALQKLRKYSLNLQPPSLEERSACLEKLRAALLKTNLSDWEKTFPETSSKASHEAYPVGVVALISPRIFPIRTTLERWVPSFLAGNATLIKMSSKVPQAKALLEKLFQDCAVPLDSTVIIDEPREAMGDMLTTHPGIRALSFVGSQKTGEEILAKVLGSKKLQMWLGGFTTNLVTDLQGLESALASLKYQLENDLWKTPLYPQRWIVLDSIEKESEAGLNEIFRSRAIGAEVKSFFSQAESEEAKIREGWLHHLPLCSLIQQSEVRLPTVTLNSVKYPFDMQKWVNHSATGYAVQLWGDPHKNQKLASKFEVGVVTLNQSMNHKDSILFGVKQSVYGTTDLNPDGLFFSEQRSVRN